MADPRGVSVESVVDPLSHAVVYLTISFRDLDQGIIAAMGTATGVIRNRKGRNYLVTALHVLSGLEPDGRNKDAPRNWQPNHLRAQGFCTDFESPLYDGENRPFHDEPLFWEHPSGPEIDVGVLPLGYGVQAHCTLDESFFDERRNMNAVNIYAMQACHIVGFPEDLVDLSQSQRPATSIQNRLHRFGTSHRF